MKTLTADRAVSAERALNTAIVNADITRGFEEYLALVDQYYAEDVEVSTDTSPDPLVGKDRLKSVLLRFLVPLHMMAEIGGLWVSIHEATIPGDSLDEQHSEWSLELIGVTGRRGHSGLVRAPNMETVACRLEYHYAHRQRRRASVFRRPSHRRSPRSGHCDAIVTMTEENHGRENRRELI